MRTASKKQKPIIEQPNTQKTIAGVVVSDKMDKTAVVAVTRFVKHKKYQKYYKVTKKYKAHDETNSAHVGEKVEIVKTRPRSKDKHFEIVHSSTPKS